ncbi:DUF4390 domain-containing protein [bacterium]|nr:DUF4390 domain-containing protein [bacterium]
MLRPRPSNPFKALLYLYLFGIPAAAWSQQTAVLFDTLTLRSNTIDGNLQITQLLDDQTMKGLRKGMTAAVEYRVQIWHEKNRWVKSLIHEQVRRIKIDYDNWERKFRVYSKENDFRLYDESELIHYCHSPPKFSMRPSKDLIEGEAYRVLVQIMIKPMSVENIEELRHWLSGEAGEIEPEKIRMNKSPVKKVGDWFFHLVVNVSGFGDRVMRGRSPVFYIAADNLLFEEDLKQDEEK